MISPIEVRRRVESTIGEPLNADAWELLVEDGFIEEVIEGYEQGTWEGAKRFEKLIARVRKTRRAYARQRRGEPDAPRMLDVGKQGGHNLSARERALSILFARQATDDLSTGVVFFRREHLPDGLLAWEEVEAWIQKQASENAPPTRWWEVPAPAEIRFLRHDVQGQRYTYDLPFADNLATNFVQMGWSVHKLTYGVPDDPYERSIATHAGGALETLRRLSDRLADMYAWWPAQASVFVLTGLPPQVEPITATTNKKYPLSAVSRIHLHIDPALSPREVADYYRMIRREFAGSRYRAQSEKHIELALFHVQREGEPWESRMAAWNEGHPDWRYTDVRLFSRDCHAAERRLLHPDWDRATGDDEPD